MNGQTNLTENNSELYLRIGEILTRTRESVIKDINHKIVITYFEIGRLILENEQKGGSRAKYSEQILIKLSENLTKHFGKGFTVRNLELMRQFNRMYSKSKSPISKYFKLTWTHYVRLIKVKEDKERSFYEIEAVKNNWSVRELNRQIDSSIYERLALSRDKEQLIKLSNEGLVVNKIEDSLKEAYVLEFLGLKENLFYSENDLEKAIINNLQNFLLELGNGFTFVSRQQKIAISEKSFYIDLVFYHRFLKAFILIDLKIGGLKHQDLGQMQMYVNYYDREIKSENENKTVGVVLCKEKDDTVVKYTLSENNEQIFAREYKLYLPKKEQFRKLINNS